MQAVIWDLDNTLFDRDAAFMRWFAALPITPSPLQITRLHALDDRGQGDRSMLFDWMSTTWPALGSGGAIWARMRAQLPRFAEPAPGAHAVLTRWPCCVLTNGSGPLQRAKLAAIDAPIPAGRVFVSGEIGHAKPDSQAFEAAIDLVGPGAVMIGDDPHTDIGGGQAAGLDTVWLRRGRSWPANRPPPTRIIDRLEDLL